MVHNVSQYAKFISVMLRDYVPKTVTDIEGKTGQVIAYMQVIFLRQSEFKSCDGKEVSPEKAMLLIFYI